MENDELSRYLAALEREGCYRVDATLKESPHEVTQRVYFTGANGAEQGPYVRKFISRESGMGTAYERIFEAQRRGQRFKHIPRIIECYQHDSFLVVVMEFVSGETLQDLVYRRDPSMELAAETFPRLCDAVTELHESFDPPLIHRDLKPSNVMLTDDGLTIIDFGIAREFKQGAESDTMRFGTRAFAPPEQFGFGQTSVRSDVYALGMLLYYCLTEKIPTLQARDAGFAVDKVPLLLRPILARATALDPGQRYASAAELKEAFIQAIWHPTPISQPMAQAAQPAAAQPTSQFPQSAMRVQAAAFPQRPKLGGWNIFVIVFTIFLVMNCFYIAVSPGRFATGYPAGARILTYGVAEPLLFLGLGFACLKKEPLRVRSRRLRNVQAWHGWFVFIAVFLLSLIIFGIANTMR